MRAGELGFGKFGYKAVLRKLREKRLENVVMHARWTFYQSFDERRSAPKRKLERLTRL